MTLIAPKTMNKDFEPVPKGNHVARLYQIIHIGTIPTQWQGEDKLTDKIRLSFELCDELKVFKEGEEAKPYTISTEMTFSMGSKANLRKFVAGFIGTALSDGEAKNFDVEELLGRACLLNVVHKEKTEGGIMALIQSATPLPKSMVAKELFNEPNIIDINTATEETIEALPQFIKDKMHSSEEWAGRQRHKENMSKINMARANRPKVVDLPPDDYAKTAFDDEDLSATMFNDQEPGF